jgi:hypothetical protein
MVLMGFAVASLFSDRLLAIRKKISIFVINKNYVGVYSYIIGFQDEWWYAEL